MLKFLSALAIIAVAMALDCDSNTSQKSCDAANCSWCTSGAVGASCNSIEDAAALPASVFTCDNLGSYKFLATTDCDKINSADSCASSDCVWCTSGAVGASCNTKEDAAALPSSIFQCDNKSAATVQATLTTKTTTNDKEIYHGDHAALLKSPLQTSLNSTSLSLSETADAYLSDPLGYTTLYHSEVAYCGDVSGEPSYMDRNYNTNQYTSTFECAAYVHSDNSAQSTRGYVGVQPNVNAIIVSFRGSEDLTNWLTNIDAIRVTYDKCDGCSVHSGFLAAEQSVYSQVLDAVSNLNAKYPNYKIAVTGHSLGAALATLTALDLQEIFGNRVVLYNYGCPRMFNQAAADWASSGVLNIAARRTHYKDIVPHSPPYFSGYRHTNGEIYEGGPSSDYPYFPGGPLKTCYGEEDDQCADQWDIGSVSDHLLYSGVVMGSGGCSAL
jgi:hypothetical protein